MNHDYDVPGISLNLLAMCIALGLVFFWGYCTGVVVVKETFTPASKHYTIVDNPNCNIGRMK